MSDHHHQVRLLGASLSTTALLLYIGIVTYLPALALEQVEMLENPSIRNQNAQFLLQKIDNGEGHLQRSR